MYGLFHNGLLRWLACLGAVFAAAELVAAPRAVIDERHRPLLEAHCQRCHGSDTQESGVRVDDLPLTIDTVAAAERWQKVLDALKESG